MPPVAILTLSCLDRPGIVAAVSGFLASEGCNILESAQFFDPQTGRFFLRTVFASEQGRAIAALRDLFTPVAGPFGMEWQLHDRAVWPKVLLMVSKFGHCLHELLYQQQSGNLPMQVVGIVSNHETMRPVADFYGVPYHHLPVKADQKLRQEAQVYDLVTRTGAELVVLARYMQILSDDLSHKLSGRCINIHHSFLPSFKGAKPYHQAHLRGVKIIGATAHYVTRDLDEGPIIDQETTRITHAHTPEDMIAMGQHLESLVLSRAVRAHVEQRVLLNGNKTVVFQ